MITVNDKREDEFKKALRKNYYKGQRIMELNWKFDRAMRANDFPNAAYYDEEINKSLKAMGIIDSYVGTR